MNTKIKFLPTKRLKDESYGSAKEDDYSTFVGIRYKNENVLIHYPSTLFDSDVDVDNQSHKKKIYELIKTLKYSKNTDDQNEKGIHNFDEENSFSFWSYVYMWNNFKNNGRPVYYDKIYKINTSGKINWKKTMNRQSFIVNNDLIYSDIVFENKNISDNIITEIYDYCLYRSIEMIWYLTNISNNIIHPINKSLTVGLKNKYIQTITEELQNTFNDDKRILFNHMLSILHAEKNIDIMNSIAYGVDGYQHVYEKLVDILLGNVKEKNKYYPKAIFKNFENNGQFIQDENLSNLRPDTLNLYKKELFIIDSKFYEFGNMPQTSDVAKQIVYGENAKTNKKAKKIYNVFLIPRKVNNGDNLYPFKFAGYSYGLWNSGKESYQKVLTYYFDLNYIIENYRKGYNEKLVELLKNDVKKIISSM